MSSKSRHSAIIEKISDMKSEAEDMTYSEQEKIKEYRSILKTAIATIGNDAPWGTQILEEIWAMRRRTDDYKEFFYDVPKPNLDEIKTSFSVPQESFWEKICVPEWEKRISKEMEAQKEFAEKLKNYYELKNQAHENYLKEKEEFDEKKRDHNNAIDTWRQQFYQLFENGDISTVEWYVELLLCSSLYPDAITGENEVSYDSVAKIVVVSFKLPTPDALPQNIGYKYVANKMSIEPIPMKIKEINALYENVIQQTALRVIYEVFKGISIPNIVDTVVFNGWVDGVDRSTGQNFTACVISVQAERNYFEKINLERIDPKECLKGLRAIYAGPLYNLAPVKPILELNRDDARFVSSIGVLDALATDSNLATMPWEDFEHLVRELFGKIFSKDGAEVRVTQASRDGGVDAVAFDPDPIRGGKFVIQAKRYNNVVPVSACRDLYGTMINEGAVKGFLVTTSHFGSDSREFVKDKPITLIDGSNLVFMLNEHGYEFKINTNR